MSDDDQEQTEATIARLEQELAQLKAQVSRRHLLRRGTFGAAAVVAATVASTRPAAADDPNDLTLGASKSVAAFTEANYVGSATGAGFLFQSGNFYNNSDASYPAALAGWATLNNCSSGVYAFTQVPGGFGIVSAVANNSSVQLLLVPFGPAGPARPGAHTAGEIICDETGTTWQCVQEGTPGTWLKLAGKTTAGAFHAIAPQRVYDSRIGGGSRLAAGTERTVSTATSTAGGPVTPAGATAVTITLTITSTLGSGGYVAVRPAGTAFAGTSSINWFGAGQTLATTVISGLGGNRQLILRAAGNATHVLVDVTGYYR